MIGILSLTGFTTSSSDVSSDDVTVLVVSADPASIINITLQREQPTSLWQSQFDASTNLVKSVFIGIIASLWATPSSARTEEFSIITTSSMAKTGTPVRQILLNAFAYCNGTF